MKKVFLTIIAIFALGVYVNAQTQTYNLSATVLEYIEVNPANGTLEVGEVGSGLHETINPGDPNSEVLDIDANWFPVKVDLSDNVYANCPFQITYSGDPTLSKLEAGGNGVDKLKTDLWITNIINSTGAGVQGYYMRYTAADPINTAGTYYNQTVIFTQAPHDGEVRTMIWLRAALPHLSPDFGNDNTWQESADAGLYTSQVVATYSVFPGI